jgi:two-component system LytT family sensor kinase
MTAFKLVTIHILCWAAYVALYAVLWSEPGNTTLENITRHISMLPFKLLLVYTCILYLIPHYLNQDKYVTFTILLIALMTVCVALHMLYLYFILRPEVSIFYANGKSLDWKYISKQSTFLNSPLFFALAIVMTRHWYEQKAVNTRIKAAKLSAELQLLKNQLQPHFFFNTLNNLYSLAIRKSDEAPATILKLAELMRYLTYQQDTDKVTLKDELDYIYNYTALEEIRYQDTVKITYDIQVQDARAICIPPLILAPFLENAFKHGAANTEACTISLSLQIAGRYVCYSVSNTKPLDGDPIPTNKKAGVGLINLRKRLEILFRDDFFLEIKDNQHFTATLKIPFSHANI